ncbi:MAG: DUF4234 domain-containing protein [Armatimonadetes bacterium]|jgi:hypothetical protein|nr:DUF4234 domain-containing protein [Armatimonadota bacterium]HOC31909.1 DUF4234 domain-containing protein [Armatimonadota bacterium]
MARGTVRSIPAVIVLTIITCGLYGLVWYYEVSRELQEVTGQTDTSPGLEVLLIVLTCGLYVVYWWFKYGKMLAEAQSIKLRPVTDNSILLVALSVAGFWYGWLDLVNMAIMQSDLNRLWEGDAPQF